MHAFFIMLELLGFVILLAGLFIRYTKKNRTHEKKKRIGLVIWAIGAIIIFSSSFSIHFLVK